MEPHTENAEHRIGSLRGHGQQVILSRDGNGAGAPEKNLSNAFAARKSEMPWR
jgi:hypothetical protein